MKAARIKENLTYRGNTILRIADFAPEIMGGKKVPKIFPSAKGKELSTQNVLSRKNIFKEFKDKSKQSQVKENFENL